jgi:hypothetical protein
MIWVDITHFLSTDSAPSIALKAALKSMYWSVFDGKKMCKSFSARKKETRAKTGCLVSITNASFE